MFAMPRGLAGMYFQEVHVHYSEGLCNNIQWSFPFGAELCPWCSLFVCLFILLDPGTEETLRSSTASTKGTALWHCLHGLVLLQTLMENQAVEVKRSKVRGGNGRGERAGMGWDGTKGRAKPSRQES